MDVLAPGHGWARDPFGAEEENGRIYGRGALDMKADLAAMVYVADTLRRNRVSLRGGLVLAMVADEVGGSRLGTAYLVETGRLEAAWGVEGEPTGPAI
jgi:succinyl-diaminopimelate desuccinylase